MTKKQFYEPTPVYWRKIGDFALVLLVAIQPMVLEMPIVETTKYWIDCSIVLILVGVKFWSNTKSIH